MVEDECKWIDDIVRCIVFEFFLIIEEDKVFGGFILFFNWFFKNYVLVDCE